MSTQNRSEKFFLERRTLCSLIWGNTAGGDDEDSDIQVIIDEAAIEASRQQGVEITDLEEKIAYSPTAIMADIDKVQATIDWFPKTTLKDGLKKMWDAMEQTNPAGTTE